MNKLRSIIRIFTPGIIAVACFFSLSGCDYEVPLTSKPTRKVDEKLLGDWISKDGKEKMKVRRLDDWIYIVLYNGDLFRAFHSDVAKTAFVSVQDIDSPDRKYSYLAWKLSDDGKRLGLRVVNNKVIPNENKDSESIQKLVEKNLQNPELLGEETQFSKEK
ncbi:MAG: hypothetical protein ABI651_11715 [Verrucomicrobiota bacterium]